MPVNQDQFQVTPYTSTVPLLQIPPDAISGQTRPAQPLQGEFGRKGTGALAIGDSLLKGFMLGHEQKEQRKQAQAQATINAADAAANAAYDQYQTALTNAGGKADDPKAQAAYQEYIKAFQAGKQAKAQFVIPEKTQKGKKAAADTDPVKSPDDKKKKNPVSAGFNNIKDFFEANPHIIPQLALVTMQPKPQGLSAGGQEQVQNLETNRLANEAKQRQLQNEKTYQDGFATFAHLSPEQIAALPPDAKKGYDAWQNARAAITPLKYTGTAKLYDLGGGKKAYLYPEEAAQYYPDAQPVVTSGPKPGTEDYFQTQYALANNLDPANMPPETTKYLHDVWAWKQANQPGSVSTSTTNPQGDRTTTTRKTAPPPPQPPPGVAPVGAAGIQPPPTASKTAPAASGGITPPPTASAAPTGKGKQGITAPPQGSKTAKAGITPPPGKKETALTASVTRQAVTKQQEGYRKAETAYTKALADADKAFAAAQKTAASTGDQSILQTAQAAKDRAYARAKLDLLDAKDSVAKEYDTAVKSIGGTPGGQDNTADNPPPGASARVKDANGKLIGWAVNGQFVPLGQ